jgi:DNA-binding transcriptional regulator YiaG
MTLLMTKPEQPVFTARVSPPSGVAAITSICLLALFGTSSGVVAPNPELFVPATTAWQSAPLAPQSARHVGLSVMVTSTTGTFTASPSGVYKPASPAADLRHFHEASGLTWDQVARMFGVSRRSVHLWAAGGRMSSSNEETLARLTSTLVALQGETPDARRHELLRTPDAGLSVMDAARRSHASNDDDINRAVEPVVQIVSGS